MHRHPPRDANAYSRELFVAHPDANEIAVARLRLHPEIASRADQHFLNVAHVAANVLTARRQLDNRIADQLAGAVVSHIAAATGFKKLDAQSRARHVVGQDVRAIGRPTQRDDVLVFEQQKLIRNFITLAPLDEIALQRMRFVVRRQTEETCFADWHRTNGAYRIYRTYRIYKSYEPSRSHFL